MAKAINLSARYRTNDLVQLFAQEEEAGITGMNLKLIVDLIEWRLEEVDKGIKAIPLNKEGISE
jgi:mannose/fructose-specific phosphotransferase system component IIA